MKVAIGKSAEDELVPGSAQFAKLIKGNVGVITANMTKHELEAVLDMHQQITEIKAGQLIPTTIKLHEGPIFRGGKHSLALIGRLEGDEEAMPATLEVQLRKLGMPTKLNKGTVELYKDFVVCEQGKICTPEQAQILVRLLFGARHCRRKPSRQVSR